MKRLKVLAGLGAVKKEKDASQNRTTTSSQANKRPSFFGSSDANGSH